MRFHLIVHGAPWEHQCNQTAYHFAQAAHAIGHDVVQIFFYQAGALTASKLCHYPENLYHLSQRWRAFAQQTGSALHVCMQTAMVRGVLSDQDAQSLRLETGSLDEHFAVTGLKDFVRSVSQGDKLIHFPSSRQ